MKAANWIALREQMVIIDPEDDDRLWPPEREQERLDMELYYLADNGAFDPDREVIEPEE